MLSLGYANTRDGRQRAEDIRKKSEKQHYGTRYTGGRSGLRSLMDSATLTNQMLDYEAKYQGQGSESLGIYNLKVVGDDGNTAVPHATINIGGRLFKANDNGRLRILDSAYINEEVEAHRTQRQYEEAILESCLVSNQMARHILGEDNYRLLRGRTGTGGGGLGPEGMSDALKDVDAYPDTIMYYDPTSTEYSRAIAKLRGIIHKAGAGIVVNEEGGALSKGKMHIPATSASGQDAKQA